MMNNLMVVEQREVLGVDFKIYGDVENPLFLAKDVASWIEVENVSQMLERIEEEEKLVYTLYISGQNREVLMITEDGLYEVLMQSRKPIAKEFKKQVKQILKDIRKHGMYATENTIEKMINNPDFTIQLLTTLKEERVLRLEAERTKAWISDKKTATALNNSAQKTKEINRLRDSEKKVGEVTATEIAAELQLYSKNGKLHSMLIGKYIDAGDYAKYTRTPKMLLNNGSTIVDVKFYKKSIISKIKADIVNNIVENGFIVIGGIKYKASVGA